MDDHRAVTVELKNLSKEGLIGLGTALGLYYSHLQRIGGESLSDEMVAAWLREDDGVTKATGPPTWASLAATLEAIGHTGVASRIRESKTCSDSTVVIIAMVTESMLSTYRVHFR